MHYTCPDSSGCKLWASMFFVFVCFAALSLATPIHQSGEYINHPHLQARAHAAGSSLDNAAGEPLSVAKETYSRDGGDQGLTRYVNVFVGTAQNSNPGNVFAGATIPFGMAKVGLNVEGYAPAGYVSDNVEPTRGLSPLHDSGTGSSAGSFGNFCIMPVTCRGDDVNVCPTLLDSRYRHRENGSDVGRPGYFATVLNNSIGIEATSTRRATLERYTFPASLLNKEGSTAHLVLDWTNDSPGTFRTGVMDVDWEKGRVEMSGTWRSSFAPDQFTYNAYQCVDLLNNGKQTLGNKAVFGGDRFGLDTKRTDVTHWDRSRGPTNGQPIQAGVVVGFKDAPSGAKGERIVTVRRGVSFKSVERACQNMEEEISDWDFERVSKGSNGLWEEKLKRIELDPATDPYIRKLFYTSFYRTFLSPNNATGDGPFETEAKFFDGLYCVWDTYRTLFPFIALTSPQDYADIVDTFVDGYKKKGYLPECRANVVPGYVQGANHGVEVLAHFAAAYRRYSTLGVSFDELYEAMVHDIDVPSPNFEYEGRQSLPFQQYGFLPFDYLDVVSAGLTTRSVSRSLEYSYGDFTAALTAATLNKSRTDIDRFVASALKYQLNYDKSVQSDGFRGFVQQRYMNGSFRAVDPTVCSPIDHAEGRSCSLQQQNTWGTYESSSWEYSFYAPHDGAGLVELLGGKETFEKRLDHFFAKGLYQAGNEPSFDTPSQYHHIGKPYKSVRRVRSVVHDYFDLSPAGVPGNDDNAAMASLLAWMLLGFYPVPGTTEMLILSPWMPSHTIHNALLGDVTIKVINFDPNSIKKGEMPEGTRAFVKSIKLDGIVHPSVCRISFDDLFPAAATGAGASDKARIVEIEMTDREIDGCGDGDKVMPMSLSKGGFF